MTAGKKYPYTLLRLLLCAALLLIFCATASASDTGMALRLPESTLAIEEYAFSGSTAISEVILPDGLLSIGAYAFSDCTGISSVYIPASVQSIGEHAFPLSTQILSDSGSYAEQWAYENGYNPRYYALLVGQEYTGKSSYLPGCFRDVDSMKAMLASMSKTPYQVTVSKDLTASGILSAVGSAFSAARDTDVCLFYYSGHGLFSDTESELGSLVGTDFNLVTLSQLKSALDAHKGSKVVILDSCYSGTAIRSGARAGFAEIDFDAINAAVISAFAPLTRSAMASSGYYVLTSASASEECVSGYSTANGQIIYFGAFTYGLLYGSGYNEITAAQLSAMPADKNGDGAISLSEGHVYANARAQIYSTTQNAQCYPENSSFILWKR